MSKDEVYEDGYDAYWDGVGLDANPYPLGSPERLSWESGWLQAQRDDEGEEEIPGER